MTRSENAPAPGDTPGRLSNGVTRLLLEYGQPREYTAGTRLIHEGDRSDAVYAIVAGRADVLVDSGYGRAHHVARLDAGAVFGEIGIFHEFRRTGSVDAVTDLEVIQFANDDFMLAVTKLPELNFRLLSSLSWKVEHTNRHLATGYMNQSRWAVAFHLLRLRDTHQSPRFILDPEALARTINCPRDNIHALLDEFTAEGALEREERADGCLGILLEPTVLEQLLNRRSHEAPSLSESRPTLDNRPWL
ncbi:MAG: Crp/Fnr family transcriptional regulator [Pseudomonadota bacterium]